MSEKEEVSLPKATISKIVRETLPEHIKCSSETRDAILECCIEFIHLISSEANEICNQEKRRTISAEHILKALEVLGFTEYSPQVSETLQKHRTESKGKNRSKGTKKLENLGISEEQLLAEQQRLFSQARSALTRSQEQMLSVATEISPEASSHPNNLMATSTSMTTTTQFSSYNPYTSHLSTQPHSISPSISNLINSNHVPPYMSHQMGSFVDPFSQPTFNPPPSVVTVHDSYGSLQKLPPIRTFQFHSSTSSSSSSSSRESEPHEEEQEDEGEEEDEEDDEDDEE